MDSRWVFALAFVAGCAPQEGGFDSDGFGGSPPESTQEASGGSDAESSAVSAGGSTALGFGGTTVAPVTAVTVGGSSAIATTAVAAGGVSPATVSTAAIGGTRSVVSSSAGGATLAATTAAECRFLSPQASGVVDMGPCSVYTAGRSHCVNGECVDIAPGYQLDCDHDGIQESHSSVDPNCGRCGNDCRIVKLTCRANGSDWNKCAL